MGIQLDYLVVGHVTRDLAGDTFTIGGTVSYSARTARVLGCHVGVVTSASPDLDLSRVLEGILVARSPATVTTTFENTYTSAGRRQVLHGLAETMVPDMVPSEWLSAIVHAEPSEWRSAIVHAEPSEGLSAIVHAGPSEWRGGIVHVGPVARECAPELVDAFGDVFLGVTPQGWMRHWDEAGTVGFCPWENAEPWLARADSVVLSEEDVGGDGDLLAWYATQTRLLVVTDGLRGCTVYHDGQVRHFPAPPVREVDPTGAGDVFATAFFVSLRRTGDPWASARFANCVASQSVMRVGLDGTPTPDEVAHCRQATQMSNEGPAGESSPRAQGKGGIGLSGPRDTGS